MAVEKIYGRLTVLNEVEPRRTQCGKLHRRVSCRCECGKETIVFLSNLRSGTTVSCKCYQRECIKKNNTKHGHNRSNGQISKTYIAWQSMKNRCLNPNKEQYKDYGARGITVCDRWLDFQNFLADMGEAPAGMSLDRIDNNGNYEPGNCRWATIKEQNNNTRRQEKVIWHNGKFVSMKEFAEILGISIDRVRRMYRNIRAQYALQDF